MAGDDNIGHRRRQGSTVQAVGMDSRAKHERALRGIACQPIYEEHL